MLPVMDGDYYVNSVDGHVFKRVKVKGFSHSLFKNGVAVSFFYDCFYIIKSGQSNQLAQKQNLRLHSTVSIGQELVYKRCIQ